MNMPKILYKYLPPQRSPSFFYKPTLRFTPPEALNDPFEVKPSFKGLLTSQFLKDKYDVNCLNDSIKKTYQESGINFTGPVPQNYKNKIIELISLLDNSHLFSPNTLEEYFRSAMQKVGGIGILSL